MKLNKTDEAVVKALQPAGSELTLQEITDKTGLPGKKIFRSLRKLFESELIDTNARKYKLLNKPLPTGKAKKGEEEDQEEE